MTDQDWNVEDYFAQFPDPPPYTGPVINMPLSMKVWKVGQFITEVTKEVHRCLGVQADLSALLLCLATVDYMAGFFAGRRTTEDDYVSFLSKYFPSKYQNLSPAIYHQLRTGLMHNLVALNPWQGEKISFRIHANSDRHLEKNAEDQVMFSIQTFLVDLYRAWVMYAHDLIMEGSRRPEVVAKFNRRFNKLDGQGALMERVPG